MLQTITDFCRSFTWNKRGNVVILFGLTIVPIALVVGAATDYGRALIVRDRMASAADAAALAVGSWRGLSEADLKVKAQQFFDANFSTSKLGTAGKVELAFADNDIKVSVNGSVPTTFLKLANISSIDVGATSTVTVGMGTLEVAMALDNSGSMSGSKLSALKTAADDLVETLFAEAKGSTKPDPIKISVVPFAAGVNVGPQYADANWMDTGAKNPYHADAQKEYGASSKLNNFDLFKSLKNSNGSSVEWAGCVEARPYPYDVTDASPTGNSSTLFVPMFAPDEPDNWTCTTSTCSYADSGNKRRYNGAPSGNKSYNNYLPDAGTSSTCGSASNADANWVCANGNANCGGSGRNTAGVSEENAFGGLSIDSNKNCKYGTSAKKATVANVSVGGISAGPNFMCTTPPLLELSDNKAKIKAKINEMVAEGATGVGEGAMWAWRTLSPGAPFTEGRPYKTEDNQKVLILMTDGVNTYYPKSHFLKSWYSIYGYVDQGHLGTTSTSSSTLTDKMNERTLEACTNIKAAGVIVYTVAFAMANENAGLSLLQSCASGKDRYFAPNTNSDLISAFRAIGKDISELRISN